MKKIANILLFICCLFVGLKSYADVLYEDDMSNGWTLKKTKSAAGTCGLTQDKGLNWTFDVSLAKGKYYGMYLAKTIKDCGTVGDFVFKFQILNKELTKGKLTINLVDDKNNRFITQVSLSSMTLDWQDVVIKGSKFRTRKKGVKIGKVKRITFGLGGNKKISGTLPLI